MGEQSDGDDLLAGLNPQQAQAVTHPEGPVLVVAGAGSGKTRVLTHRIAYLVQKRGVRPYNILAITFTNRAAAEMRERVEGLIGGTRGMWVLTFHAACGRILRRDAERLGYRSNFTIYDDADQVRVVKSCLETLDRDPKRFPPRGIHSRISAEKNRLVDAAGFREQAGTFYDEIVADVFELYERRLHEANAMDFDDLLVKTVELLEGYPEARAEWQDRFRHLLVDEYQDTNHAQYRFIQAIGERTRNVFVVGDSDQSVYSWRGADIQNILGFEKDFPDAETIRLEQNYRSTQTILDAANAVIEHNEGRLEKHLWSDLGRGEPVRVIEVDDEHSEARLVAGRISQMLENGSAAREVAVFYRTNAQSRVLEDLLVRMSIPYQVIGGPRFYERAEIKDAMAYLQLLDNLANEVALRRIINTPKRGIGSTTVEKIATLASTAGTSMWETIATMEPGTLPTAAERALFGFRGLIDDLRERVADCGVGDAAEAVIERSGMVEAFEAERTVESQGRVENLQELVGVAREYTAQSEDPSLTGFLQEVSLVADADSVELDERGKVTLMTLHNAKGLEFENVFVTGMEQNLFPHARSIEENNLEEERRLFYVAITRARQRLTLAYARQRTIFGNRGYALPSQFLDEIPADLTRRERAGGEYGRPMSSSYGGRSGSGSGSRDWGGRAAVARGGYGSSTTPAGSTGVAPREDVPTLSVGDGVRHKELGDGVVLAVPDGGQVVVRFAADGSERRLLLAYAPLDRID